jgi:hypothetical protein
MFTARLPFRRALMASALVLGLATSYSIFAQEKDDFDRFDGTGKSKAKIDVIEWEQNIEIHSDGYGKVLGLGAKLDDRDSNKKVLVIGFRLNGSSGTFVRRATLGIPFTKNIKGFKDPTAKGYEKFAITNHDLGKPWVPYKLDPAPTKWYPDGHPGNEESAPEKPQRMSNEVTPSVNGERNPANGEEGNEIKSFSW